MSAARPDYAAAGPRRCPRGSWPRRFVACFPAIRQGNGRHALRRRRLIVLHVRRGVDCPYPTPRGNLEKRRQIGWRRLFWDDQLLLISQNAAGLAPPPFTIQSIEVCAVTDMAHWNN